MKTSYFTFGQAHVHEYDGAVLDRDVVLKLTAEDPLAKMRELFGEKWSFQYEEPPDPFYFPRGIHEITA